MIAAYVNADSLITWMLYSLLLSVIVTAAAMLAHDAQRAANRAVRWTWISAIVVVVMLTLSAPLRRDRAVDTARSTTSTQSLATLPAWIDTPQSLASRIGRITASFATPINTMMTSAQRSLARIPIGVQRAIALLWLVSSIITLGVFAWSYSRVRGMMRRWPKVTVGGTVARVAPSSGPAVVGLAPSEIVVPAWLLSRSSDEQQLVVTHENEHVRARDPWLLVVACVALALMPWNPLLWYAFGRLRLAIELDCDRRVLQRGIRKADYGALLIDLSGVHSAFPSAVPAFVVPAFSCTGSYLERRLLAMTSRPSRFAASRRVVGGLLATVAVVTACESTMPTSAEIDKMDAKTALAQSGKLLLKDTSKVFYIVDDKHVSAEVANKIAAEQIASISIDKGGANGGVVTLRTKQGYAITADTMQLQRKQSAELRAQEAGGVIIRTKTASIVPPEPGAQQMKRKFDGLFVIDGKISDPSAMESISPDRIENIEVVKGAAASAKYSDPRAANGVILVTTKK